MLSHDGGWGVAAPPSPRPVPCGARVVAKLPGCPAPSPAVSVYEWGALISQTVKCCAHTASDGRGVLTFSFSVLKSTVQKQKVGTVLVVQVLRIRLPS